MTDCLSCLCPGRRSVTGRPLVWEVRVDSHRANGLPHDWWRALNGRNPPKTRPAGPSYDVPGIFLILRDLKGLNWNGLSLCVVEQRTFSSPFQNTDRDEDCHVIQGHWIRLKTTEKEILLLLYPAKVPVNFLFWCFVCSFVRSGEFDVVSSSQWPSVLRTEA